MQSTQAGTKKSLSEEFAFLAQECQERNLSLQDLLIQFGVRGHAFIVLLFSMPLIFPIPLPGLPVIFGIIIALSGIGIVFGTPILLPKKMTQKTFSATALAPVFRKASKVLKKLEWLIKPRLSWLVQQDAFRRTIGFLIFLCGFILFLPLPPGTNFPPAIVCVLLSVGLLERDFAMICLGLASLLTITAAAISLFNYFVQYLNTWIA